MSSSNYYTMRSAKVRIAEELSKRGWTIHGFKEDESDSMTDYYSPANWDGIATKNGFTLVIDQSTAAESKPIKKYNYSNSLTCADIEKIKKLEQMTAEHGATEGEAENAKRMIEKIKASNNKTDKPEFEIVGYTVAHMANPGRCKWHIEKDSAIFDKGTGITKYDDVPDSRIFDIDKMEFTDSYKYHTHYNEELGDYERVERILTETEEKAVKDLKALILRWERVINSMNGMYNGTEQNRKEADEQQQNEKMEKVIEKVTKKVLKMVEVTDRKNIQVGDFLAFSYHGGYWKVTDERMQKGTWNGVTESRKAFTYERVGASSRGYKQVKNTQRYYDYEFKLIQSIEKGSIKIYELKEVEEVTEVEKWVRVRPQQTTKKENTYKAQDQETKKENNNDNTTVSQNSNYDFTITQEQDTRDNSNLWVVRLNSKLDREQWKEYDKFIRSKKGYYSRFKGGHIFKFDPSEILNQAEQQNENTSKVDEVTEQAKEQTENLLDISTTIIEKLHLSKMEYINSIEYKEALTSYLLNSKIKISKDILKYLHDEGYSEFEKVLADLLNNENDKKDANGNSSHIIATNYEKLIDKINKQIQNNDKRIEHLSGNYLTNTWKRMREQESRDNERYGLEADNRLLNYLLDRCSNKTITELEQNLIIGTFRNEIHSYYGRYTMDKNITSYRPIEYPVIKSDYPKDGWYNLEVPKLQKRLNKAKIFNTEQLIKAVEEYKNILELIERGNTTDLKVEQIKKLEREYKMHQKGDINFTSSKELLNMLMDYVRIEPNDKVLEPEAGIGYIADKLKEYSNNVDVCEYDYSFSELLKLKGYNVLEKDFLKLDKYGEYDKIVMNPPFSNNQDIKHIRHAYNMLNSNGKLVAICSPHWTFSQDKQSQEFRNWLEQIDYEVYDVPEKSFEFTNVNCKILVINKNENDIENAKAM